MMRQIFCLYVFLVGYVRCQYSWQYGGYPRYGYVYNGGSRQLGFGYYSPVVANVPASQPQTLAKQTIANYYQPGSLLNPANLARPLSPTNAKVVDYNEMKAKVMQARSAGQIASYAVSRNQIAALNAQRNAAVASSRQYSAPSQRQVPHPAFQSSAQFQQQSINQLIQQQQRQQKELQSQLEHQRQMVRQIETHFKSAPKQQEIERPPLYNYPRQGFQLPDKPKSPYSAKTPMFQKLGPFGSSYLTGAGRAAELRKVISLVQTTTFFRGSLGVVKPMMQWIQARNYHG